MSVDAAVVIKKLQESVASGDLVVIIGTGVSIGLTNNKRPSLSWQGLIADGLQYASQKGKIRPSQSESWNKLLHSEDMDDMLGAAEFVGRKLSAPDGDLYFRWLESVFSDDKTDNPNLEEALRQIKLCGVPICTLNYDGLLEKVTGLPSIDLTDLRKASEWVRRETPGIFHLHGQWRNPASCVLGIRDYADAVADQPRGLIQKNLSTFKRLLFIGCGDTFSDPNFSALIAWLKLNMQSSAPQHYALVTDDQYPVRHADESWHGFVEPLSYGSKHTDLPGFITKLFNFPGLVSSPASSRASTSTHEAVIEDYKQFLIRDCGQMTIEGVRADMDTAQRRFDLEKLFVPLQLEACPPDIPASDPERDEKLKAWVDENKEPLAFGQIFEKKRGLALLALPGGGKTLLLKRLAVAYASPSRRANSADDLPDIDTVPVLIRCREWRDYIQLPILTLFKKFSDITGQPGLTKFSSAIIPRLKSGNVLLLIDGLDEIHVNSDREIFVDNLQRFLSEYPKIRVVITSREAGFNLVAAKIAGFCERWRVAPLNLEAMKTLSLHWHQLMAPGSKEAEEEGVALANHLYQSISLRRLAENPLLLTMLLVVKHGAGRLPPNRVSLYGRAVDVLLDTWNIKGHEPLNIWEAVPQLAFIALELMQGGAQTATEKELLAILERARATVPLISRYAKDTPYEFLKRVELRSSLLLEAGHQVENGITVPFYQFRHLTFQEYLASVALAEGHYEGYSPRNSVIKPIAKKLVSDEWKEVIPMVAVLAGKRASPIAAALITKAKQLHKKALENNKFPGSEEWKSYPWTLPAPIARLLQIFVEEAQIEPRELSEAMPLVAYFSKGCSADYDWKALARGPYAIDFLDEVWKLYEPMDWDDETWIKNSFANFVSSMKSGDYLNSSEFKQDTMEGLSASEPRVICCALMTYLGSLWHGSVRINKETPEEILDAAEKLIHHSSLAVAYAATWCWSLIYLNIAGKRGGKAKPSVETLDIYLHRYLTALPNMAGLVAFSISTIAGLERSYWKPALAPDVVLRLRGEIEDEAVEGYLKRDKFALAVICFHSQKIIDDTALVDFIARVRGSNIDHRDGMDRMLSQLGEYGKTTLVKLKDKDAAGVRKRQKSIKSEMST
ncbi:histidine kinase [Pseudomonas parafulva]|uniref:Histidine kinase n=1 Tax=Pseudomonas parafulva TaxID=157782 RepID=A0AAI8KA03_9PSED|nr:SIR2 family protein [Pseudomonas parafulva]AXO87756.1 histidine kinase [Pseudomonas parafulva]